MSENEEKLHYVVNTMALEGMFLTAEEKNVLRDCLEDKYSIFELTNCEIIYKFNSFTPRPFPPCRAAYAPPPGAFRCRR